MSDPERYGVPMDEVRIRRPGERRLEPIGKSLRRAVEKRLPKGKRGRMRDEDRSAG